MYQKLERVIQKNQDLLRTLIIAFFTVLCSFLIFFNAAFAGEKGREYRAYLEELTAINRIPALQRPEFEKAHDILRRAVEDRGNKVVGEIQDIVVSRNGSISSLFVEFDRLRLRTPVFLNYRQLRIQPVSSGYRMQIADDQIEDLYPELLAAIETASGNTDGEFSVNSLLGASVESTDGRILGKVDNILFRSLGSRADTLYISMTYNTLRGRGIAIPFETARYKKSGRFATVLVDEDQADAMIDYAKRN